LTPASVRSARLTLIARSAASAQGEMISDGSAARQAADAQAARRSR
jgi:hypothetical protein